MLSFDHVSLVGPRRALSGLRLTPTDGDERHARVHLDGAYLELRITEPTLALRGVGWFLRPDEPSTIAGWLARVGVQASAPAPHRGIDGSWSDISLSGAGIGAGAAVVPGITHRVDRRDWPPAAGVAHPNGAVAVAGLELATPDAPALARLLTRLGAVTATDAPAITGAVLLDLGGLGVTLVSAPRPALRGLLLRGPDRTAVRLNLAW